MIDWNSQETREFRARNPLGVSSCRFTRLWGQLGEDNEKKDHLAIMPSMAHGAHAACDLLKARYLYFGFYIPAILGNHWAGDKTGQYGVNLAKVMKLPPYAPQLFFNTFDLLMRSMAIMENGNPARSIPVGYFEEVEK